MNSAQVAFLDFVWKLAFISSGQKWMHSLGREIKKKTFYMDRIYGSFEFVLFTSEIALAIVFVTCPFFWYLFRRIQVLTQFTLAILSTIDSQIRRKFGANLSLNCSTDLQLGRNWNLCRLCRRWTRFWLRTLQNRLQVPSTSTVISGFLLNFQPKLPSALC